MVLDTVRPKFMHSFGKTQFGARNSSSTTCAMISLLHHASRCLESPSVSGLKIVSYDLSKAFDTVSHNVILESLSGFDFPKAFISWIQDYLAGRTQATRIGCIASTISDVHSGVPQGSVLGPMLFCCVVGRLEPLFEDTCVIKYIDDTTLCMPLYKNSRNNHIVTEHNNIVSWFKENSFKVNLTKCKSICYRKTTSVVDIPLEDVAAVSELKFLGMIINDKLTWSSHIQHICRIASRRIYALRVLRPILSSTDLCAVYCATIRSVLEYGSPSFGKLPINLCKELDKIQRRCHRLVCVIPDCANCSCGRFPDLQRRRVTAATKLFRIASITSDHVLYDIIPPKSHRSQRFIQPSSVTSRFFNTFIPYVTTLINNISA